SGRLASKLWAAKAVTLFDRYGHKIEVRFYDAVNHLVRHPESGRAVVRFLRDSAGRVLEEQSFDTAERPVNRTDKANLGWFRRVYTYSPEGRETSRRSSEEHTSNSSHDQISYAVFC